MAKWKRIVICLVGLAIGALIALQLNKLISEIFLTQDVDYLYLDTSNNWWMVGTILTLMLALVVCGVLIGKKVENA